MVHPLSIVCRSVVWLAILLVSSDGRVAGFGEVRRVSCGVVFLTRRSVTVSPTSLQSVLASVLCAGPGFGCPSISCLGKEGQVWRDPFAASFKAPRSKLEFQVLRW